MYSIVMKNENIINNLHNMTKLPYELKNIIFEYDGRIKYKYKIKNSIDYHKYVNVIHKHDQRYNVIQPIIERKIQIMKDTDIYTKNRGFGFMFCFNKQPCMCLYYEYHMIPDYITNCWSNQSIFYIRYVNMKEARAVNNSDIITTVF
jgi:hypothetical protein